ncbi:MAG: CZB domain-containing protein [Candidatus Omnitrophica bacterium]|nr:CZB domain-containing protein [Candidatus Omnitrophota bacterium]
MNMNETISKAIGIHSKWTFHLEQAIRLGTSDYKPEIVKSDSHCEFGKWLVTEAPATLRILPIYRDIKDLHAQFHIEAGRVLALALSGKKEQAAQEIGLGSRFKELSSTLVLKLASLKTK